MDFKPRDYYEAAKERLSQAELLFNLPPEYRKELQGEWHALVIYLAGVAVESMLRAYRLKISSQFDSRHNLSELFVESGLDAKLENHLNEQGEDPRKVNEHLMRLRVAVDEAAELWRNAYRYASEKLLFRDFLKRGIISAKSKGSKASMLRQKAKSLLRYARVIVEAGDEAWN